MSLGRLAGYLIGIFQPTRDTAASAFRRGNTFWILGKNQRFTAHKFATVVQYRLHMSTSSFISHTPTLLMFSIYFLHI